MRKMHLAHAPCARASARQALVAFTSTQQKFRGVPLGHETRLTRRRHRSCVGSAPAARGREGAHEGGGGGSRQGETVSKRPAPALGWSARMGTKKLKQINIRKKVRKKRTSKSSARAKRYNAFIAKVRSMGPRGQWREVLSLLDGLAEDGIPLNSYTYNSAMSSIAKSGRWREALGLRDRMVAEGIKPDGYSFNALIEACSKGGQVDKGLELLREMVDAGVPRDCFSYNAALVGYVHTGDSQSALKMLDDMVADGVRPDLFSYSTVLACCGKGGEWRRCMSLMDQMRSEGIVPNVYCFSSLINACGKAGRWALAVKTLEDMESSGLTPNEHNWLTAIGACGNAGRWEEALQLIDKLEALARRGRGVPMSTTLYNFAIDTCARAGRWDQGVLLLERMKTNRATPPDARTYSCLIKACAEDANLEDALAYLSEMRAVGLAPTIFAYISAMSAIKMAGRWEDGLGLLDEMEEAGLIPDVLSFNNVVDAYGKEGQLAHALVQSNASNGIDAPPSNEVNSTDLTAWQKEEPDELAMRMENNGIKPGLVSFNVLIDACARGGKHWTAAKILKKIKSSGLRPNKFSYDSVIQSCRTGTGDEWRLALELLDDMRRSGLTPDIFSFNTAIGSCVKSGDWRRALDLLAGMKVEGLSPDVSSYNGAISACAKAGQWRIGLELLAKVRADPSVEPNQRTYTAAINCFQHFQAGQSVASLGSTLAGFSDREETLLNQIPTSDVLLGLPDAAKGKEGGND